MMQETRHILIIAPRSPAIVHTTNEEIANWSETTAFRRDILDYPWVVSEHDEKRAKRKAEGLHRERKVRDERKRRKLPVHGDPKCAAAHNEQRTREEDKRKREEERRKQEERRRAAVEKEEQRIEEAKCNTAEEEKSRDEEAKRVNADREKRERDRNRREQERKIREQEYEKLIRQKELGKQELGRR